MDELLSRLGAGTCETCGQVISKKESATQDGTRAVAQIIRAVDALGLSNVEGLLGAQVGMIPHLRKTFAKPIRCSRCLEPQPGLCENDEDGR